MGSTEPIDAKVKVHVSFSEADIDFVDKLLMTLVELDRFELSVSPGADGPESDQALESDRLIAAADVVLFVLSPVAVAAEAVSFEAEQAQSMSKKRLSVIGLPLRKARVPPSLADLKPIRLDTERLFKGNLWLLVRSLDEDVGWIRRHTSFYTWACAWEAAGHDAALLLTGADIIAAKAWTFERPDNAPKPTDLHIRFIQASEAADSARKAGQPIDVAEISEIGTATAPPRVTRARARRPAVVTPRVMNNSPAPPRCEAPVAVANEPTARKETQHPREDVPDPASQDAQPLTPAPRRKKAKGELAVADAKVTTIVVAEACPKHEAGKETQLSREDVSDPSSQDAKPLTPAPHRKKAKGGLALADAKVTTIVVAEACHRQQTGASATGVDPDSLAYVPASLKVSWRPNGPTQPLCKEPTAPAIDDAAGTDPQPADEQLPDPELPDADVLTSKPQPKKGPRPHAAVIAQDELDGLLSSLLAQADKETV